MGKRGPKPRYKTAAEFEAAVVRYIEECEETGIFPDEAGMRLYLGLRQRRIAALSSETENPDGWQGYKDALEYARDKRESWLVQKMVADNKAAAGCMNALKQPANGGYVDRPVDNGKIELKIKVDGVGGMEMFK